MSTASGWCNNGINYLDGSSYVTLFAQPLFLWRGSQGSGQARRQDVAAGGGQKPEGGAAF